MSIEAVVISRGLAQFTAEISETSVRVYPVMRPGFKPVNSRI
jgi:hypothetical protein